MFTLSVFDKCYSKKASLCSALQRKSKRTTKHSHSPILSAATSPLPDGNPQHLHRQRRLQPLQTHMPLQSYKSRPRRQIKLFCRPYLHPSRSSRRQSLQAEDPQQRAAMTKLVVLKIAIINLFLIFNSIHRQSKA